MNGNIYLEVLLGFVLFFSLSISPFQSLMDMEKSHVHVVVFERFFHMQKNKRLNRSEPFGGT